MPRQLSADMLLHIMQGVSLKQADKFSQPLTAAMEKHSIDTPLRQAHFLAQVAQESGRLAFTEELASGTAYEGRKDLGNTQPGDGPRFKGRGLLQLTGRSIYTDFFAYISEPLLTDADARRVALEPALAAESAAWFWQNRKLNTLADANDLVAITKRVNGGLNGFARRQLYLGHALACLRPAVCPAHAPALTHG